MPKSKPPTHQEISQDLQDAMKEYGVEESVWANREEMMLAFLDQIKAEAKKLKRSITYRDMGLVTSVADRTIQTRFLWLKDRGYLIQVRRGHYLPKATKK